jgi:asparagine synthase (glutamine-hydrolysing)
VPVGVFLSGGVDSSLIAATMQRCASGPVTTLTLGFEDPRFNEADHARAIAGHLGTKHIEDVATADQALAVVAKLGRMYDEPLADSSQIPTFLVCEMARKHVTVALSGDGGDEVFAGYRRHFATPQLWRRLQPVPLRGVAQCLIRRAPVSLLDSGFGFLKEFSDRYGAGAGVGQTLKRVAPWLSADSLIDLHEHSLEKWPRNTAVVAGVKANWGAPEYVPENPVDQLCLHDMQHYLPGDILNKVDRAAMAVSLETRIPYLDPDIVRFSMALPASLRLQGATGKLVLRETLKRYVPERLFDRQKTGFAPPLEAWLLGPLREWAEDLLSPAQLHKHKLLDVARVRRFWERYVEGGTMQDARAWSVLQFQSWMAARS